MQFAANDQGRWDRLLKDFFLPYLTIRNRMPGYAVSIVKAGAAIVGHGAGPVRPPLTDLVAEEVNELATPDQGAGSAGLTGRRRPTPPSAACGTRPASDQPGRDVMPFVAMAFAFGRQGESA